MKSKETKTHTVRPEYRTNQLSLKPGGSIVTIVMKTGQRLDYENVKNPDAYIRKAASDPGVDHFLVDGALYQYH
jgi:hypothetical protein